MHIVSFLHRPTYTRVRSTLELYQELDNSYAQVAEWTDVEQWLDCNDYADAHDDFNIDMWMEE